MISHSRAQFEPIRLSRFIIAQIFFSVPTSQHKAPTVKIEDPEGEFLNRKISFKHVRLSQPEVPFQEMQLGTLFLPNTQVLMRRGRELQREGLRSGESVPLRISIRGYNKSYY
jgi:hypothetical protein